MSFAGSGLFLLGIGEFRRHSLGHTSLVILGVVTIVVGAVILPRSRFDLPRASKGRRHNCCGIFCFEHFHWGRLPRRLNSWRNRWSLGAIQDLTQNLNEDRILFALAFLKRTNHHWMLLRKLCVGESTR